MAENAAYNLTTETIPDKAEKFLGSELERRHFFLKVAQLVLSLVAFICEEDFYVTAIVGICFIIASIVFAATMDQDSRAKVSVAFGFFASIAFLAELFFMYKSGYIAQSKETTAAGANGTVENQPLNVPVQASA
ncbi:CKLF-like MARVEL transmembrane domain-containing protein 6 isoform X2 [Hyla sarda]|uniref:CKLF-like MARVEL transmembrane domain-containing protein 6 isoform X2 n=1 Tax=Hyla sarda TaxID=327740 RepID=UPI0024C40C45|nr:CKLF-like MARVEL transmembrane domain-containing protein 6 isoform X2 [Hyla sarda]